MIIMNWQTKKLGEVCEVGAGNSAPQKEELFKNGRYPFFRTSDVGKVRISKSLKEVSDYLNDEGIKGLKFFEKGTILLPKSGASTFLNHRVIMGIDGYVVSHLATIKTNEKVLNNVFLFYYLQGIKAQDLIQDHKYPSLNISVIKQIQVPIPSLSTQTRIVKILDKSFAEMETAKNNAERNLRNAKELFESCLQEVFANRGDEWEEKKLGEILEIERGGSPRPINSFLTDDKNSINWIKIGDTKNVDKYIYKTRQKIIPEGLKKSRLVKKGDFILSNSMSFGKPYIMKTTGAIHDGWLVLREKRKNEIDKDYLYNVLKSPFVFKQFDNLAAGSTVRNLNIALVSSVVISFPKSLTTQKQIVSKLDTLSASTKKLEKNYQQKIDDLDELKKSVLKKAFEGEL